MIYPVTFSFADDGSWGLADFYGQTAWASVHRDSRNSDYAPIATAVNHRVEWSILEGAALINPGIIGPSGLHYVTSGRGIGFSHLHAFNAQGHMVWQSEPQKTEADLDSLAAFNSPVVDPQGDIYIGDSNQFWAFHAGGEVKWVIDLPSPGEPFVYQVITQQGYVGGITVTGEVLFYHPNDGTLAVPSFTLPVGVADPNGPGLPGLWKGGLFDRKAAEISKQIAFGYKVQVANAPAVHPVTGRIFITAAGPKNSAGYTGFLYGLDVGPKGVEIGFSVKMGGGSGTSPAISPDGRLVYAADGNGTMLAVDTKTGDVRWRAKGEGLLSPAIGGDGTLYTGDIFNTPTVFAIDGLTGKQKWARSYDSYAASVLPELQPYPPRIPSGKPIARLVSVISVSTNNVWVGMEFGYEYFSEFASPPLTIPHKTAICALQPENGDLLGCTLVRDSVEGMIKITTAGRLYVSHTAIFSSTFYYGLNDQLPERYRLTEKPAGGLSALAPITYCEQLSAELQWVRSSLIEMEDSDKSDALSHSARKISIQLTAIPYTVLEAVANKEFSPDSAISLLEKNNVLIKLVELIETDRSDSQLATSNQKQALVILDETVEIRRQACRKFSE